LQISQGVMSLYWWMFMCTFFSSIWRQDEILSLLCSSFLSFALGFFLWSFYCSITNAHAPRRKILYSFLFVTFKTNMFSLIFNTHIYKWATLRKNSLYALSKVFRLNQLSTRKNYCLVLMTYSVRLDCNKLTQ
jgi:hypothetical protein